MVVLVQQAGADGLITGMHNTEDDDDELHTRIRGQARGLLVLLLQ